MATDSILHDTAIDLSQRRTKSQTAATINDVSWTILRTLGSLKITVTMFAFSILILFVGTLAQDEQTMIDVKKEYFNSWVAMVPHHVFAPVTIFGPHGDWAFKIPMPGGATIGLILLVNLIAAKATRFKMNAKGSKMWAGYALVAFGLATTVFVIVNSHAADGLQGEPPFSYDLLWQLTVGSTYALAIGLGALAFVRMPVSVMMRVVLGLGILSVLALAIFLTFSRIPDPGLRIVWQLFKSLIAGVIMLVGLTLLFGKRGGNVLIHLAVGLLMLGQFVFGDRQNEEKMILQTGETSNLAIQPDEVELAFIETLDNGKQRHVAIDQRMLLDLAGKPKAMAVENLPFDIRVDKYMKNSKLARLDDSSFDNIATDGIGLSAAAIEQDPIGGAVKGTNMAAAYISLIDKDDKHVIDSYLVSQEANDAEFVFAKTETDMLDSIAYKDKSYDLGLRFRRNYKSYDITLDEVKQINYSGTDTPRDYSSYIRIENPTTQEAQIGRVWMNNPMRFDGETFYQSEFYSAAIAGVNTTGLQVVTNAGWLVPYLACVFAGLGMFVHFGYTFVRFSGRFDRELDSDEREVMLADADERTLTKLQSNKTLAAKSPVAAKAKRVTLMNLIVPAIVVVFLACCSYKYAVPPVAASGATDWYAAGQIPMQEGGRLMPLDSVAKRFLQTLSGRTSTLVRGNPDASEKSQQADRKIGATEFFFALANGDPIARQAKVFRIDADELRKLFELDPRESGGQETLFGQTAKHRYSLDQLEPKFAEFQKQSDRVRTLLIPEARGGKGMDEKSLTFADRKILELNSKLNLFAMMADAYHATPLPQMPSDRSDEAKFEAFGKRLQTLMQQMKQIDESKIAGMVPPTLSDEDFEKATNDQKSWKALNPSTFAMQASAIVGTEFDAAATRSVLNMFESKDTGSSKDFEQAVASHIDYVRSTPFQADIQEKMQFEAWYNHFNPFAQAIVYYSIAFVLALLSFLFFRQPLRRAAFWICALVLIMHSVAIVTRIYISGRPPVINLYSSAVYIGWAGVLAGLVIEIIYPIRLGVLVGSSIGVLTLLVAWGLDTSDTMPVLQAVLDTQFWLTTHVQCITLGYAATFFAGAIAVYALIHRAVIENGLPSGSIKRVPMMAEQKILYKLCYGVVCFGLFFSFIGTVLGGLWADDSWGRFWGWDPKENGALMIVMWNAILLHARWDKMVLERGFYLLAVGGNIMTAWSWFGTNQLGIGLHSYGFTESVLFILAIFVATQIAIIIAGVVFTSPKIESV